MIRVKKNEMNKIEKLFDGIEDSMVTACLQGYMGAAYVNKLPEPDIGFIVSGEYSFFGGEANTELAKELVENIFEYIDGDFSVAIYSEDNLAWRDLLLSVTANNPKEVTRFGILQKDYEFDRIKLKHFIDGIPTDYELKRFDKKIYEEAMLEDWSKEFCETFESAEDYLENGFGYAVIYQNELVSGASSMTVYDGGIEVQIATKEEFQRRGLALPCAAALLEECMKRKLRPCWDAATLVSKYMALKLGYEYKGDYSTVHLQKSSMT